MSVNDPMMEAYIYENMQMLESLEEILLDVESSRELDTEQINEIFRIMHTIKGASGMMGFDIIMHFAHSLEDMYSNIREKRPRNTDWSKIIDITLAGLDFLKNEMIKIQNNVPSDGDGSAIHESIKEYLAQLSKRVSTAVEDDAEEDLDDGDAEDDDIIGSYYKIVVRYEEGAQMESVRSFGVVHDISAMTIKIEHIPTDLLDVKSDEIIVKDGFIIYLKSQDNLKTIQDKIMSALFVESVDIKELEQTDPELPFSVSGIRKQVSVKSDAQTETSSIPAAQTGTNLSAKQTFINVPIEKLSKLVDLIGEIVITELGVVSNPEIKALKIESFEKAADTLRKNTDEMQQLVMSMRMVPIASTFQKMKRIVHDMSKKINKEVDLELLGEDTEVDKNIIDNLNDPLMHLIRNSMDHGIEPSEDRILNRKPEKGKITLEASNTSGDIIITVSDDGKGLDKQRIIQKAIEKGLTTKSESEISDQEAFSFIMEPGFSTKEQVSEYSGRGVGMDVVRTNIEKIGGSISIESSPGIGTKNIIKIPLTLAIVEGMNITIGKTNYIVPIKVIDETFRGDSYADGLIVDPDGSEMVMIRGDCYPIIRLHEEFNVEPDSTDFKDGIMLRVTSNNRSMCLFADKLIGEQKAVQKQIPPYIMKMMGRLRGIGGCTVMGDGSISLIIEVSDFTS